MKASSHLNDILVGVEQSFRIKHLFDIPHDLDRCWVLRVADIWGFHETESVLCRYGSAVLGYGSAQLGRKKPTRRL